MISDFLESPFTMEDDDTTYTVIVKGHGHKVITVVASCTSVVRAHGWWHLGTRPAHPHGDNFTETEIVIPADQVTHFEIRSAWRAEEAGEP